MPKRYQGYSNRYDDKKSRKYSSKDLSLKPNNPTSIIKNNYDKIKEVSGSGISVEAFKDYIIDLILPCLEVHQTMTIDRFKKFKRDLDDSAHDFNRNQFGQEVSYKPAHRRGVPGIMDFLTKFFLKGSGEGVLYVGNEDVEEFASTVFEDLDGFNMDEMDYPDAEDLQDHGEPLGKKQKNNYEDTPIIKGTGKGMDGKKQFRENVRRLNHHFSEIVGKKFSGFSVLVRESDGRLNRTPLRGSITEAVIDLEEVLQLHHHTNVALEGHYAGESRRFAVVPVKKRTPIVAEGRSLYRFNRTAEASAQQLIREGVPCSIARHNWGFAIIPKKK